MGSCIVEWVEYVCWNVHGRDAGAEKGGSADRANVPVAAILHDGH